MYGETGNTIVLGAATAGAAGSLATTGTTQIISFVLAGFMVTILGVMLLGNVAKRLISRVTK